jgi:hypothetical protein
MMMNSAGIYDSHTYPVRSRILRRIELAGHRKRVRNPAGSTCVPDKIGQTKSQ